MAYPLSALTRYFSALFLYENATQGAIASGVQGMKLPILWSHFNTSIQFGIGKDTKENWIKLGAQTIFKSPEK